MRRRDTHYRLVLFERLAAEFGVCSQDNPDWQPGRMPRDRVQFESIICTFIDVYGGAAETIHAQVEAATSTTLCGRGPASHLMQTKIDAYRAGMIDCSVAFGTRVRTRSGQANITDALQARPARRRAHGVGAIRLSRKSSPRDHT